MNRTPHSAIGDWPGSARPEREARNFFGRDSASAGILPTIATPTAPEREALSFAVGVLTELAEDGGLPVSARAVFRANASQLQALLDRARNL